ncbi:MAG: bifunctional nuclease family protein [Thermoprotei archaeon]|mgnify:CR=1 FL=1|nr:bifunctional nuclease family protein [Thermoproteales archaeon]RLE91687.1 MAG: bifunctional nuclease family protein [Thermoprotei archaeon]
MSEEYTKAHIVGVYESKENTIIPYYIVLVKGETWDNEVLPISIGGFEAVSINDALEGYTPQRPMTHDLIVNILNELDVEVEKITIDALINNIYTATIVLKEVRNGKVIRHHIDARPSDSIAIALRTKAPIYVSESLRKYAVNEDDLILPE